MSYEDQVEGFTELLETSGVDLTYKAAPVRCLVARDGNEAQTFDIAPGECQQVIVSCFKDALENLPTIGNYFEDDEGGRYRVTARRPNPGRPVAKFVCEYSGGDE